MKTRIPIVLSLSYMLVSITSASSAVELRFTPPDTVVSLGDSASLAIVLDDALDIRTVEAFVQYDTTVVRSISGEPGLLFQESGVTVLDDFEEEIPGEWHGYAIVMGAYDYVTGPGELYIWNYETVGVGVAPVIVVDVLLYAPNGSEIPDVTLAPTTIAVIPTSVSGDAPEADLHLAQNYPNPFNPATKISFDLPHSGQVLLIVNNVRGELITILVDGFMASGHHEITWDGQDDQGQEMPSGVYFYRIEAGENTTTGKMTLVR